MAAAKRPYLVTFQGKRHLVEAISREQATSLVVAPHVTDVHAASPAEVMDHFREKEVVTSANEAGDAPAERKPIGEDEQD